MKTLSKDEVSRWLAKRGQVEDPYNGPADPRYMVTFEADMDYFGCENFVRCFLDQIITRGEVLVVVDDAAPAQPSQEFVSQALRYSAGETRSVQDAPGYLVPYKDREKAVALFSLMSGFRWKCYLYGSYKQIVLYNWEGEIFDAWTDSERLMTKIRYQIKSFDLKEIKDVREEPGDREASQPA